MLLLSLALACADPPPPPDVHVVDAIVGALREVPAHYRGGHDREAIEAWREAHATFEASLEPGLRENYGDVPTTELELLFGRIRHELDQRSGDPDALVTDLCDSLVSASASIPDPPPVP